MIALAHKRPPKRPVPFPQTEVSPPPLAPGSPAPDPYSARSVVLPTRSAAPAFTYQVSRRLAACSAAVSHVGGLGTHHGICLERPRGQQRRIYRSKAGQAA